MHFCQDEAAGILAFFGTIGITCKYCWYKLTGWRRKAKPHDHEH